MCVCVNFVLHKVESLSKDCGCSQLTIAQVRRKTHANKKKRKKKKVYAYNVWML